MQPSLSSTLTKPSDAELASRLVERDCAAFEQIYDRHSGRALGMCIGILGDRRVSEEVLQESFWRAWQKADSYDAARASFAAWLFSIVHHCAIDELRRLRSRGGATIELDADDGEANALPDPHSDVMTAVLVNMQSQRVQAALAKLPTAQRSIIVLAYYGGYTHQEIAVRLGEPIGTIHSRTRLGLSKLRGLLGNANA